MSQVSDGDPSNDDPATAALWTQVKDDICSEFGDDAAIRVRQYSNHIEVSIIPERIKSQLERKHQDITVVPYHALQMTIRKDD